jgi:hypothetical protein
MTHEPQVVYVVWTLEQVFNRSITAYIRSVHARQEDADAEAARIRMQGPHVDELDELLEVYCERCIVRP